MVWYRVVKTIKGHRYVYEQRTWREGKRVRTQSRYIGLAGTEAGSAFASVLGSIVVGPMWRVESGHRHERGASAWDVVSYESDELGNMYLREQVESLCHADDLRQRAAGDLVWVTATKTAARRYGDEIAQVDLPAGSRVIALDRDGGLLVLRGG